MLIIGIMLVRNEDLYVELALRNAIAFCDRMIVCDNGSTDGTPAILERLAEEFSGKIELHRIEHPRRSHELIRRYAGTETWIFAVDGDEIYDPERLAQLRPRLLAREFQKSWLLIGNVLNCRTAAAGEATGFFSPPSRSITKLFNFSAIDDWSGDSPERLHGGEIRFRAGWDATLRRSLHEEWTWEESLFRCLHLCFMHRSTLEQGREPGARKNVSETVHWDWRAKLGNALRRLRGEPVKTWKDEKYARGELATVDVRGFGI